MEDHPTSYIPQFHSFRKQMISVLYQAASVLWIYQLDAFEQGNKQGEEGLRGDRETDNSKYSKLYGMLEESKCY